RVDPEQALVELGAQAQERAGARPVGAGQLVVVVAEVVVAERQPHARAELAADFAADAEAPLGEPAAREHAGLEPRVPAVREVARRARAHPLRGAGEGRARGDVARALARPRE